MGSMDSKGLNLDVQKGYGYLKYSSIEKILTYFFKKHYFYVAISFLCL